MFGLLTFICSCEKTLAIVCVIIALKLWVKWTTGVCRSDRRLTGKTVIVTGANTGIGKETARDLAKRGAKVILACRDLQKATKARDEIISTTGNKNVVALKLDLSSLSSVREFAREILAKESRLHVLINNAGAGGTGRKTTEDGLILGMQINHFGPFLLTNLLIGLMKKSSPSRIIFVSSLAHKFADFDVENLNFDKWFSDVQVYNCSKLANVLTSNELARKLAGTGVTVNSLHPGAVRTDIFRNMPSFLRNITNFIFDIFFKSAEEGAQTSIYLAVSDEVNGVTGKYFADCKEANMSSLAQDEDLAKKVWEKSESFVHFFIDKISLFFSPK